MDPGINIPVNVMYSISGTKLLEFPSRKLSAVVCDDGFTDPKLPKQLSKGLPTLDLDSIHINLAPQSTSYEIGSIHYDCVCTTILNSWRFVRKAQLWSCYSITCNSLVHSFISGYPIPLAMDTVCSHTYNNASFVVYSYDCSTSTNMCFN